MPPDVDDVDLATGPPPVERTTADGAVASRVAGLLPVGILIAGFGLLASTHWSSITTAAGSSRALVLIAAFIFTWVGIGWGLRRVGASVWIRCGVMSPIAIVVVLLVVVPYFSDTTVIEEFPTASTAPAGEVADDTVDPPAPPDASEPPDSAAPATPAGPVAPAEPVRIAQGELNGIGHSASGTAAIYRQPDGTFVIGLEGIDIENGPDYFVWVVPGADAEDPGGGTDLGALRGNRGTQFYDVPDGVEVTGDWTVLVWCRAFAVPIAAASPV